MNCGQIVLLNMINGLPSDKLHFLENVWSWNRYSRFLTVIALCSGGLWASSYQSEHRLFRRWKIYRFLNDESTLNISTVAVRCVIVSWTWRARSNFYYLIRKSEGFGIISLSCILRSRVFAGSGEARGRCAVLLWARVFKQQLLK